MILVREADVRLHSFAAVMHCPSCGGSNTALESLPSEHLRDGVPIDVLVKWRCRDCRRVFSPPDHLPERGEYVLMCGRCGRPWPHVFREARSRAWRAPRAEPAGPAGSEASREGLGTLPGFPSRVPTSRATTAWVEIYACESCGQEREYGIGRPPLSSPADAPERAGGEGGS